jgi:putative dehydrogenase
MLATRVRTRFMAALPKYFGVGKMRDVGVIGLGSMGLGMAQALIRGGMRVHGYDVSEAARSAFADFGGIVCDSPAHVAQSAPTIFSVVVNAAQTESVLIGEQGILPAGTAGSTLFSCATVSPPEARRLAELCEKGGMRYVDAPISGGPVRAAAGEMTMMLAGAPDVLSELGDVIAAVSGASYNLGTEIGNAAAVKIVNQLLAGVHIVAACEAMALAGKLGIDLDKTYEVITASAGNSWMFENRVPHILEGDYSPKSAIDIFVKDMGIVMDLARAEGFAAPMASSALQMYLAAKGSGYGREDDASVARVYASLAGVELPGHVRS